jgi:hypothetical protein
MATALARIFEDDHHGLEMLIICPKNLVPMWDDYRHQYRALKRREDGKGLARHRLVLIDESHNLRNRENKRYKAIAEYISANDSRVILLSATPYNKTFLDLSNQLRLFIDEHEDIGSLHVPAVARPPGPSIVPPSWTARPRPCPSPCLNSG